MPFAGYEDFDACVAANSDKDDPEAYCGKIKHEVEGRRTSVRLTPRDAAMAEVELRRLSSRRRAASDTTGGFYVVSIHSRISGTEMYRGPVLAGPFPTVDRGYEHIYEAGIEEATVVGVDHLSPAYRTSRRVAHDVGARTTLQHCPFCGSGSIYARSDGSAECQFCDSVFTVQLQPTHPGTPGTVDGQPYDPFEEGAIEDEDPMMEPEEVLARRRRLHAAWLESQNTSRGTRAGRVRH